MEYVLKEPRGRILHVTGDIRNVMWSYNSDDHPELLVAGGSYLYAYRSLALCLIRALETSIVYLYGVRSTQPHSVTTSHGNEADDIPGRKTQGPE